LKMDVPAGKLGSQFNSFVNSYNGGKTDPNSTVPVTIGLGGSFLSPSPKLLMDDQKKQVQDAATAAVKQETQKQADKLIGDLLGKPKSDTVKTDSTKKATKPADQLKKEATDKIQNLLKKKKN